MPPRRAIVAAVLTFCAGTGCAQDRESAVGHVVACAVDQAGSVHRSTTQAERATTERRVEVLKGLVPQAALAVGLGRQEAEAALTRAMQGIETRSLTLDPPGIGGRVPPAGCEALADAPDEYLDGLRRR